MDLCMLYDENSILVVVVFICSRIRPFLLLKCFYFACTLWYTSCIRNIVVDGCNNLPIIISI